MSPALRALPLALLKRDGVAAVVRALSVKMLLFSRFVNSDLYRRRDVVPYLAEINSGEDVIISDS